MIKLVQRWWVALFGRDELPFDESNLAQATTLAELEWLMRQRHPRH